MKRRILTGGRVLRKDISRLRGWSRPKIICLTVWLFLAVWPRPSSAQGAAFFVEAVQVHTPRAVPLDVQKWESKWKNRVFHPRLLSEMEENLLSYFHENGYYFAHPDSQKVDLDSLRRKAKIHFWLEPEMPLRMARVEITNRDSLSSSYLRQLETIASSYQNKVYNSAQLNSLLDDIMSFSENRGFPLAQVETKGLRLARGEKEWQVVLQLRADPGDSVQVSAVRFQPKSLNQNQYLLKLLRFRSGQAYNQQRISKYREILSREDFIKGVSQPRLVRTAAGKYLLELEVKEAPATSLDGIIGYIPPPVNAVPKTKGYFTGLVNIVIRNLFGTGRKFAIFWQKPDRFSDEFRLFYREPFVLGLPFHAGGGMNRLVRDTTYIEWQYHFFVDFPLSERMTASWKISNREVAPDSLASRILRLPRTQSLLTETGLQWDGRDNNKNPRKGMLMDIRWTYGRQKNIGPPFLIEQDSLPARITLQKVSATIEILIPTLRNQLVSNQFHANLIGSKGGSLTLPDLFWFGGATTMRGFREAQFYGEKVVWANTEYRFLLGSVSRFFLFADNGYFTRKQPQFQEQWLHSYGLGIRIPGPLGVMEVDVGLARGTPLREAKLHFRLINEF